MEKISLNKRSDVGKPLSWSEMDNNWQKIADYLYSIGVNAENAENLANQALLVAAESPIEGIATPTGNPNVVSGVKSSFIATEVGTYTNYGGLVVGINELAILYYDGSSWTKASVVISMSDIYKKLSEKVDNTYELGDSLSQTILFSEMVRAVYTTGKVLTASQSLRITYFGLNSPNFQSYPFGIQVALVENGAVSKQTHYIYPSNTDLKNNAVLKLTAIAPTILADEGLEVYVVLSNQYESLISASFDSTVVNLTQEGYNWYLNPLLKKCIDTSISNLNNSLNTTIEDTVTGGNTYKVIIQHADVDVFKTYIGEIYITGLDNRLNRRFELRYFGIKNGAFGNAPIGLQIATRKADDSGWEVAANYALNGTLKAGNQYKMTTTDPNAIAGMDVYVKLSMKYKTPITSALYFIGAYVQLTSFSWNNFIPLVIQKKFESIVTEIIVSANDNDTEAQFKGVNAIQLALNSITDASQSNRYTIYVKQGTYKITNSSQFLGNAGYPAMVVPKDHVDIIGQSKEDCVVWAELPYIDSEIDTAISRNLHQTVYNWADDSTIENITFVSKHLRYTLHQDSPYETNKTRKYKNVDFIFLGDKGFDNALGIGTYSGSRTFVDGGRSQAYTHPPVAIHNNQNFKKPSEWHFKNHEFINTKGELAGFIYMSVCGSLVSDKLELIGCSFGSSYIFNYVENWIYTPNKNDSFNHAEWRITGYGNAPFYFNNTTKGSALKIEAKDGYKNVRIDTTSSAYSSLLKNPHSFFGNLGHPERYIIEGHVSFDSYITTKGYVIGGLSIYEGTYPNGTKQSVDGLAYRLGDCSVVNKELKLKVGADNITIVFNKNYTGKTNAEIIAEINTALGVHAVASEYNISLDYYPEMTDVMSICVNGTTSIIPKGTPLKISNGRVFPATENDELFGIALDDFASFTAFQGIVRGYGRVLKRGYISTVNTERFFVKVDSQSTSYKLGNGMLIADANGSIKTIDSGIVGINI